MNLNETTNRWELNDTSPTEPERAVEERPIDDSVAHLKGFGCYEADGKAVLYSKMNVRGKISES